MRFAFFVVLPFFLLVAGCGAGKEGDPDAPQTLITIVNKSDVDMDIIRHELAGKEFGNVIANDGGAPLIKSGETFSVNVPPDECDWVWELDTYSLSETGLAWQDVYAQCGKQIRCEIPEGDFSECQGSICEMSCNDPEPPPQTTSILIINKSNTDVDSIRFGQLGKTSDEDVSFYNRHGGPLFLTGEAYTLAIQEEKCDVVYSVAVYADLSKRASEAVYAQCGKQVRCEIPAGDFTGAMVCDG